VSRLAEVAFLDETLQAATDVRLVRGAKHVELMRDVDRREGAQPDAASEDQPAATVVCDAMSATCNARYLNHNTNRVIGASHFGGGTGAGAVVGVVVDVVEEVVVEVTVVVFTVNEPNFWATAGASRSACVRPT